MIKETLRKEINLAIKELYSDFNTDAVTVEVSDNFGDYASNAALVLANQVNKSTSSYIISSARTSKSKAFPYRSLYVANKKPRDIAEEIAKKLRELNLDDVEKIKVAGAGFINFYLSKEFFIREVDHVLAIGHGCGKSEKLKGKKVMVEYTDPNPFKVFHVGHLMTNIMGESLARLFEFSGATVLRANYQGDVGMHVAKALWGMQKTSDKMPDENEDISKKTAYLGEAYVLGSNAFKDDEDAQKQIREINKKVYNLPNSDKELNRLYKIGRKWSLDHFEILYKKLGMQFDHYFFESQTFKEGARIVKENLKKGIFEKSDGAIIFPGGKYGLHDRVFLNSEGLPTYEAKDIGLAKLKDEIDPTDRSVVITANEQSEYFKVVLEALRHIYPEIAEKMTHIGHGMMRVPSGKMSSRKGNIITGESILENTIDMVRSKIFLEGADEQEKNLIAQAVGVGAIKFSILRHVIGKDIIYDEDKSLSFEGDSGPYIQYTIARAKSILSKAEDRGIKADTKTNTSGVTDVERLLHRFPAVVERAGNELAPHFICTYLLELASAFNSYYAKYPILKGGDEAPYRVALTGAVAQVLKNGLYVLGITAPERM